VNDVSAISGFCEKCNKFRKRHSDGNRNTCMSILFDTIEALQAENEQLQAKLDEWKYETKCHMDEVVVRDKEIERLKAQVDTLSATVNMLAPDEIGKECRHIEALRKARKALYAARVNVLTKETDELARDAVEAIDALIGGKQDV
jgi:predicted nuclease with TOPRIM domain